MELLDFEGQSVLDSRDVAKMIGKTHAHLIRDIDGYIQDINQNPNLDSDQFFIPSTYRAGTGKEYKCYLITREGCEFVANKMTGKKGNQFTAQYVSLFNSMKKQISNPTEKIYEMFPQTPRNFPQALRALADSQEQLAKQKPKVDYFDSQMRNPGLMTITEIAKDYGWSANTLNKELNKRHIIFKQGKHWVLYQKYADKGYTQYEPYDFQKSNGQHGVHNNLKWTQKGKKFIYDLLAKDGIHPILEQMNLLEME